MVEMCKLLLFFSFFSFFFCLVSHFFHVLCSSLFWLFYYSRLHVSVLPSPPVQPLRVLLSCVFVPPFFNFHFLIYAFQFRTLTAILHFHSLVRLSPVLVEEVHFTLVRFFVYSPPPLSAKSFFLFSFSFSL